jgi:hypothetical protein
MPISKPHSTLGAKNTGSCSLLANYLDKENIELEAIINKQNSFSEIKHFQDRKQDFFNSNRMNISLIDVIDSIDNNKKKLGKIDAKYYSPTISFSQSELNHLILLATEKKEINDIWKLSSDELKKYDGLLKEYVKKVMDNYADNFNRQNKGLKNGNDLVYYAKIEHFRKFKGTDPEVKKGLFKNGDYKPGLNSHAHIIVSRKDKTQSLKLDPTVQERSTQRIIGGNAYQIGFDRMKWTKNNERTFDSFFNYNRMELEKFENQYILKNGSPRERDVVNLKINGQAIKVENEIKKEKTQLSKGFER